ncbi:MAG: M23 family metallopeptidase [Firmicutes bacterium]|nr:M23 family metallopeptidase [Bacillota bacterium]
MGQVMPQEGAWKTKMRAKAAIFAIILVLLLSPQAWADAGRTTYISGGEQLAAVAASFNCEEALLAAMNGLDEAAYLPPGTRLYLPEDPPTATPAEVQPQRITVQPGDTLYALAQAHGTTVAALAQANGIADIDLIRVGQQLLLPQAMGGAAEVALGADNAAYAALAAGGAAETAQAQLLLLEWPLKGSISSDFGWRSRGYHHGLDIAAVKGTAIGAVAAGEVISSGWLGSAYGYAVKLRHADGVETLYAHASRLCVREGEWVSNGQKIAEVGKSGNATGYHLHLELRINGEATDPLPYLPE